MNIQLFMGMTMTPIFPSLIPSLVKKCSSHAAKEFCKNMQYSKVVHCFRGITIQMTFYYQGLVWNGMEDDFSIFHTGNFLPFHFILKIFHSVLKFFSIFHSILPYQDKFIPEATRNLHCTFATLKRTLASSRSQR